MTAPRLLTLNCHEAWVHQLGALDVELDIVDGLPGRYTAAWDTRVRPVPARARLISLEEARASPHAYHCIVGHNPSDLLELKQLDAPRLLVLHVTLELKAGKEPIPPGFADHVATYLRLVGGHAVAVSELKGRSWGITDDVVPFAADPDAYLPWTGEVAAGLRIANQIAVKRRALAWDFHEAAFARVPVRLVGHNPDLPGVQPSASWDQLKELLAGHRFFVHTADAAMEDGYNMATLEAMAAGLPVLGNRHPSSPIEHGVDGFLSDDPAELAACAHRLLEDRELSRAMGQRAREKVRAHFSMQRFAERFGRSIERAREAYAKRKAPTKRA